MDQGKILVTEDEESLRFVLQKALESEGYWVQTAANGASARRLIHESHFDVSLMDIKLPDVDGLELLKEFKGNGVDTAMILMTAQTAIRCVCRDWSPALTIARSIVRSSCMVRRTSARTSSASRAGSGAAGVARPCDQPLPAA